MKFPCEITAEPYLKRLRVEAAQQLKKRGFTQIQIADLLQVTQPVVSGYLKYESDIADTQVNEISQRAVSVGREIAKEFIKFGEKAMPNVIELGCSSCKLLRQGGSICSYHKQFVSGLEDNCTRCHTKGQLIELQTERSDVLDQLRLIFNSLISSSKYNLLIPEIGLQIVIGNQNFKVVGEIAGFPERIIKRKTGLPLFNAPVFGSSKSMSKLLLQISAFLGDVHCLAGIKTSDWLLDQLKETKIPFVETQGFDDDTKIKMGEISNQLQKYDLPMIIVNHGSIGYEAISYILCKDGVELENIIEKLYL